MKIDKEDLIKSFVKAIAHETDQEKKIEIMGIALNLVANGMTQIIVEKLIDCDCPGCRMGAADTVEALVFRVEQNIRHGINENLKVKNMTPMYDKAEPDEKSSVNEALVAEMLKELENGN